MHGIKELLKSWFRDEDGPTAVEYAVLLSLIVSACLSAVSLLGANASNTFEKTAAGLSAPATAGAPASAPSGTSRPGGGAAGAAAAPAAASSAP